MAESRKETEIGEAKDPQNLDSAEPSHLEEDVGKTSTDVKFVAECTISRPESPVHQVPNNTSQCTVGRRTSPQKTIENNNPAIQQTVDGISEVTALISKDDSNTACARPKGSHCIDSSDDNIRRGSSLYRTLTFRRKKQSEKTVPEVNNDSKKSRKYSWSFRFKKKLLQPARNRKASSKCSTSQEGQSLETPSCVCMGYRKKDEYAHSADIWRPDAEPNEKACSSEDSDPETDMEKARLLKTVRISVKKFPPLDMSKFQADDYPIDDIDEVRIVQRARDMAVGIEVPPNFPYHNSLVGATSCRDISIPEENVTSLSNSLQDNCVVTTTYPTVTPVEQGASLTSESHVSEYGSLTPQGTYVPHTIHTQVDYIHCLVPDLREITNCSFYWGIMDRYEAEKLLDTKPEGTFLLRDSAQEEFLFSVSFRRYGRSLHARIEQWNHHFSFDSHDPGVFSSDTVCGLIEHYKDPSCCMFFEPMLTLPLNRNFPFSLQHLCRSVIGGRTTYDGINILPLPKALKEYLQYYHYKQKVRVRRFEVH